MTFGNLLSTNKNTLCVIGSGRTEVFTNIGYNIFDVYLIDKTLLCVMGK